MDSCPCGSGQPLASCCQPWLDGAAPPTALQLMRSRYSAYVLGNIDHILATHDPATRESLDREATRKWAQDTRWKGLEIVATQAGGPDDQEGVVEFVAKGEMGGGVFAHRERSTFKRIGGRWFFIDGVVPRQAPAQAAAAPGRNDPCPCGSGKKYKRCHGA